MGLNLFQRKAGGSYYARGTVAGQRIYESLGTGDRRLADALRIRREAELLERHALGRAATVSFAEAALTYLEAGGEGRFLGRILEHFGSETLLKDIDNEAVNRAARALYPEASPATVNRQLITPISAVVSMAAEDGLCEAKKFRRRKGDKARLRWLTPEEAERLIAAVRGDARLAHILPALGLLLGGGLRTGEAIALNVSTFYANSGEAFIARTKNGHPRMIRLPERAVGLVTERGVPEIGALLRTPKGGAYAARENGGGQLQTAFNRARDAAGLGREVTPHVLRHTWATWYYAQTRDFGGLMDLGGWIKADMANRYRKIAPEDLGARLFNHGWDFTRGRYQGDAGRGGIREIKNRRG
jgi:integrase